MASTVDSIEWVGTDEEAPTAAAPRDRVAVVYERSAEGRAALLYAHALAVRAGTPLTVLAVASERRTDIGCACGRQGAVFHNALAREFATAELGEARKVVSSAGAGVCVDYALAPGGSFTRAVLKAADGRSADAIVLPAPRTGPLRRFKIRDRAARLQRRTGSSVIVAPRRVPAQS